MLQRSLWQNSRKYYRLVLAVLLLACSTPLSASLESSRLINDTPLPLQGSDNTDIVAGRGLNTETVSSIARPGVSQQMLELSYANGIAQCLFIDNAATSGYFVPLATYGELAAFVRGAPSHASVVYGCPAEARPDPCGNGNIALPRARSETRTLHASGYARTTEYRCDTTGASTPMLSGAAAMPPGAVRGCGRWVEVSSSGACTAPEPVATASAGDGGCTASGAICDLYDRNLGRTPDQAGAAYWQDRYNVLASQGLSETQIAAQLDHDISGNAEAQHYALTGSANQGLGQLASGTPSSDSCWGSVGCSGTTDSAPASEALWGWNSIENVIGASYVSNGISANFDQAGLNYWTQEYEAAVARGQSPEEAAQNVANAIATASSQ